VLIDGLGSDHDFLEEKAAFGRQQLLLAHRFSFELLAFEVPLYAVSPTILSLVVESCYPAALSFCPPTVLAFFGGSKHRVKTG
jgi:hypothetical protein